MNRTLAPKDLGGILGETFTIYKNNFLRLIAIVAIVQVPIVVLYIIFFSLMPMPTYGRLVTEGPSPLMLFIWISIGFAMLAASICMVGAVIHAVAQQHFNQPVSIGRAYSFAWRRLGDMFWATALVYLALFGIYLAAILMGVSIALSAGRTVDNMLIGFIMAGMLSLFMAPLIIYLGTNWNFLLQTALFESCGPTSALSRSWALVKGSWWRVLGIILLLLLILQTIATIIVMIFYIPAMTAFFSEAMSSVINQAPGGFTPYGAPEFSVGMMIGMIIAMIGAVIGLIISYPIFLIGQTLLYFDLRVRKHGYSLDALAGELGLRSPSTDIAATSPPV